jgi:hypothetical protein
MRASDDLGEIDTFQMGSVCESLHDGRMVRTQVDKDMGNTSLLTM